MGDKKRPTIAVMMGNAASEYSTEMIAGFRASAKEEGANLIFFMGPHLPRYCKDILSGSFAWDYDYQFHTIYDYVHFAKPDALIIAYGSLSTFRDVPDVDEFVAGFKGIPTLLMGDKVGDSEVPHLNMGNYSGMRQCIEHLVEDHGYRRIAFVAGPVRNFDSNQRLQAYRDVLTEHGITVDEKMIVHGNYTEAVDEQVEYLLDNNPGLEAIAFANDNMAKGGYRVCAARNLLVGHDIAITGFDDMDDVKSMEPPLSSVGHNTFLFSYRAVKTALELCRDKMSKQEESQAVFCRRSSCGCALEQKPIRQGMSYEEVRELQRVHAEETGRLQKEIIESNRKLWFIPSFTRDLMYGKMDRVEQMLHIMTRLKAMGVKSAYLFFFVNEVIHRKGEELKLPEEMYLTAFYNEREMCCHKAKDMVRIGRDEGFAQLLPQDREHFYTSYVLFSGEVQYGLILCEVEQKDFPFMLICSMELGSLRRVINMNIRERQMQRELEEKNRILSFISAYDELSQLLNRRGFMEKAIRLIREKQGQRAYLLFADVDHLKEINDCFGHAAGDFAIQAAAEYLRNCLPADAVTARIGGDEFVSLIISEQENACEILTRSLRKYEIDFNVSCSQPFYVEMSAGVYEFVCEPDTDITEMMRQSDAILYEQKKKRRKSIKK